MSKAKSGIIWSAIERFSVQGSQFILSLVIARFVTPADFGLIAMLTIFMAIAQVFTDSGFGSALIQKKDRNNDDYSTVFYFNTVISVILYFILFISAPYIADFYNQPQLTIITRWVGLNLILLALYTIQKTRLRIDLNFKKIAKISFVAMLTSGIVGVWLAYKGYGVWALVIQSLTNNFFLVILYWFFAKWRPIWVFSWTSFRKLFSFGSKLLASHLLHTIYLNLYSLVIGKFYNASDVGYYNRACTIAQYPPVNLVTIISNVLYPVQCEHQNDRDWLVLTFPKFLKMTCFIIFPIMMLLAVLARPLVLVILSEKWIECAPLISILAVAYMWIAVGTINNNLITSSGRSDLYLKAEIVKKIIAIIILVITIPFGIIWLCIGLLIYNIIDLGIIISFTKKIYPLGIIMQLKTILPVLCLSMVSAAISWVMSALCHNDILLILIQTSIFILTYCFGSVIFKFGELKYIIGLIRKS
ncbi:MAG: lipopolysaccharide biosynthesis protein [Muribaculaceae bacterium]|jgi:O-antigen/teichoic acid export membrane protein